MKNILITGASGFIGTNLSLKLKNKFVIYNLSKHEMPFKHKNIKNILTDFTKEDFRIVDKVKFEHVIHLAALSSPQLCENRQVAIEINVNATERLLKKLINKPVKKIIFMSSGVVYSAKNKMPLREDGALDDKNDNYTYTKILGEKLCNYFIKNYKMPIVIFRLGNIFGPYQDYKNSPTLVPQIVTQALMQQHILVRNQTPIRDFIFIDDATDAIIKALDSKFVGTLNLANGKGHSVGELVKIVAKLSKSSITDMKVETAGLKKIVLDVKKIRKELKWKPKTSLQKSLKKTIDFYKKLDLHSS